jgi:vacuolar-type H+-ATPase subunit I/STV1
VSDIERSTAIKEPLLNDLNTFRICYMGGSLPKQEQLNFTKFVFRSTRGKAFVQFFEMQVPKEDRMVGLNDHREKVTYIIMFEEGRFMKDRIQRLCSSFMEPLFTINESEITNMVETTRKQKEDTKAIIKSTKNQLKDFLVTINRIEGSEVSLMMLYKWFILKEQAIYNTLNSMQYSEKLLVGQMWCPTKMKHHLD